MLYKFRLIEVASTLAKTSRLLRVNLDVNSMCAHILLYQSITHIAQVLGFVIFPLLMIGSTFKFYERGSQIGLVLNSPSSQIKGNYLWKIYSSSPVILIQLRVHW